MPKTSTLNIRIYYEDTDCGNVVYHANYLRYMERGRTELLREAGIELSSYHDTGLVFAVVEANVKYKRSGRYNDLLTVTTSVKEIARATITFVTEIRCGDTLLAVGEIRIAAVKTQNGMPGRLPAEMTAALSSEDAAGAAS